MSAPFDIGTLISALLTLVWIVILLGSAGVALMRFRTTATGLLFGAVFGLWALERLVVLVTSTFVFGMLDDASLFMVIQTGALTLLTILEYLALGAGIALIPRSLEKLAR